MTMFLSQKTRLQRGPGKSRTNNWKELFGVIEEMLQKNIYLSRKSSKVRKELNTDSVRGLPAPDHENLRLTCMALL